MCITGTICWENFLIGPKSILCEIKFVFEKNKKKKTKKKNSIPHWCSYSSEQQYLSASMAGILWCGKVLFVVLNCKITFFYSKMHFWIKLIIIITINGNILPVPYSRWHFIAKSVLEWVYHIGVHIVHSNSTLNRNIFNNWCGKIWLF